MTNAIHRRNFLARTLAASSGLALAPHARAMGANDDIRVAVVGFRGQGGLHLKMLRELAGVRVVAVCDVDQSVLDRELKRSAATGEKIAAYTEIDLPFDQAIKADEAIAHRMRVYTDPLSDVEGYLKSQKGGGNLGYKKPAK